MDSCECSIHTFRIAVVVVFVVVTAALGVLYTASTPACGQTRKRPTSLRNSRGLLEQASDPWLALGIMRVQVGDVGLARQLHAFSLHEASTKKGRVISNRGGWQSELLPVLATPALARLLALLRKPVRAYVERTSRSCAPRYALSIAFTEVWINVNGPGDYNSLHRHSDPGGSTVSRGADISGVYFVHPGSSAPGRLRLVTAEADRFVKPIRQRIVLFPSWMPHAVEPQQNSSVDREQLVSPRISVAFNAAVTWYDTPLEAAALHGNVAELPKLAKDDRTWRSGDSRAAHVAASHGHVDVLAILASARADVLSHVSEGQAPLHLAVAAGHVTILKYLVASRAEINSREQSHGMTSVHLAASNGHVKALDYLVKLRADLRVVDKSGLHPVEWAAWQGHLAVVDRLSSLGAGPEIASETARLAANGHARVMRFLVSHLGSRVHEPGADGVQPLHLAISSGHLALAKMLVDARAGIDSKCMGGMTPLHLAAQSGHAVIARYLLVRFRRSREANHSGFDTTDATGATALDLAQRSGHRALAALLVDAEL
eukprot:TRINITY_DN72258_c0_g1_i1.p1 TRINITY_DN72258_c0_g1~~TRINITY_DN72258_c0_g1_i1.p1  ORF type:complete len:545 (-),score=59.16 TRINITY_DN72258_c0_g1_i1:102-1736(-)